MVKDEVIVIETFLSMKDEAIVMESCLIGMTERREWGRIRFDLRK